MGWEVSFLPGNGVSSPTPVLEEAFPFSSPGQSPWALSLSSHCCLDNFPPLTLSPLLDFHPLPVYSLCTTQQAPSSEDTLCLQPRLTLPLALSSLPINILVFLLCSEKASRTHFFPEALASTPSCPSGLNFLKGDSALVASTSFTSPRCHLEHPSHRSIQTTQLAASLQPNRPSRGLFQHPSSPAALAAQRQQTRVIKSILEKLGFLGFGATPFARVSYHGLDHLSSISFSSTWLLNLDILSAYLSCSLEQGLQTEADPGALENILMLRGIGGRRKGDYRG